VLSVEIFPSTCAAVYDLEVEHDHNYFAEGVKVSNSAAKTYHELVAKCPSIYYRYGMTGTFFRSGEDALAMHAVLSKTIYKVTAEELVERGYLVPTDVCYLPVNGPRAKGGPTFQTGCGKNGIYQHEYRTDLAAWATQVLTHHGHKVLVLVGTKEQGNTILDRLKHQYPTPAGRQFRAVEFVSTNRPAHICQNIIDTFAESSAIQVLIGTSMVGEGTDLPNTAACVYCPGQKAEVPLIQAAYRACTAVPGKTRALFVDFSDRHHRTLMDHSLERLSVFWKEATFNVEVLEDASFFGAWVANRPR
jgi:superfamily II DNA or RNA helicase